MTTDNHPIRRIAIIGAGPGGLAALNEFLHTSNDGSSTINELGSPNEIPQQKAFEKIVVFEQNEDFGGVWNYTDKVDPSFPTGIDDYSRPDAINSAVTPAVEELEKSSVDSPYQRSHKENTKPYRWNNNATYKDLYTNVPCRLMRFSSGPAPLKSTDTAYHPFMHQSQVFKYISKFVEENDLKKHIRFNSSVEKVIKKKGRWTITVNHTTATSENWYNEEFDAVVVAVGRFNTPFYPKIENLHQFNEENPGVINHTKSFRTTESFEGKKVLIVGAGVSAIDIIQYLVPVSKEVHISFSLNQLGASKSREWIDSILNDESVPVVKHPRIKRFVGNEVEFEDGTKQQFEKILFATGYHIHFPFLDHPENEDLGLVKITHIKENDTNCPLRRISNLFLHTFTLSEPTLCHVGLSLSPFFFLLAEANAVAIAGVWSGARQLPSIETQEEWTKETANKASQLFDTNEAKVLVDQLYKFSPSGRVNLLQLLADFDIQDSKKSLHRLFYQEFKKRLVIS